VQLNNSSLKLVASEISASQMFFIGNSEESIFELQFNETGMRNTAVMEYYYSPSYSMTSIFAFPSALLYDNTRDPQIIGAATPFHYALNSTNIESSNDIRAKESYRVVGDLGRIIKYCSYTVLSAADGAITYNDRSGSSTSNWIIYRLADVLLMKAEALVQMDGAANLASALELVNQVYMRSNTEAYPLVTANYPAKSNMEQLVLRERHRELLFEGKRWFDLVRYARREGNTSTLNTFVDKKNTSGGASLGAPVMDAMYMPILEKEVLGSRGILKQNPYYEVNNGSSQRE
jgi:hypothetical protein